MRKFQMSLFFTVILGSIFFFSACSHKQTQPPTPQEEKQTQPAEETPEPTPLLVEKTKIPEDSVPYIVDTEASTLQWSASRIVGNSHTGTVNISQGTVYEYENTLIGGLFTLDMNTIEESKDNQRVEEHLKSDDFFDVENFPTSIFEIYTLAPEDDDSTKENFTITGMLTIKDISNLITFLADIQKAEDQYTANAQFSIDRSLWEIKYGSDSFFANLGDKAIEDEIDFTLSLVANK